MEPSFFSLFSRSRYLRYLHVEEDDPAEPEEVERKRREAERFAVASMAFCFRHAGKKFREHFLDCLGISGFNIASERGVRVEDKRWGDLVLVSSDQDKVCVIECKIKANVQPYQNPAEEAFWNSRGYAEEIERAFPGRDVLYFVLSSKRQALKLQNRRRVTTFQKRWTDLKSGYPHDDSLAVDLYGSLARLGIDTFTPNNTRDMKIGKNSRYAFDTYRLLRDAYTHLDLADGKKKFRYHDDPEDPQWWSFGFEVRKSDRAGDRDSLHGRLQTRVAAKDARVLFYGYAEIDEKEGPFLQLWFYIGTKGGEEEVRSRLKPIARKGAHVIVHPSEAGGYDGLEVRMFPATLANANQSDQDWFVSVIEAVAKK